ncbi:MAG: prolyl-tRNA synthetase associated domain-containing protein [Lachnospiraceae bacterium]|nr:prolyl-tRNA synthetase associated domain-containing protein [Lachnospiraceae bacterium]
MRQYPGRPPDETGRLPKEIRTYDLLDRLRIPYFRIDHERIDTIAGCEEIDRILGTEICKNLFLCNTQKTDFYLLLMPGAKKFRTADLSKQIGAARLSFAPAEYMERFLDITPGSVSIMGLMNDTGNRVRLLIDQDVLAAPSFGCHPCINTSSIRLSTEDVLTRFLPAVRHEYTAVRL